MNRKFELAYTPNLDRDVALGQELNLVSGKYWVCQRQESEIMTSGNQSREDVLEPEEALAVAIARQAAEDWLRAACRLRLDPRDREAQALRRETEAFFRSRWFHTLMDLDGEELIARMRSLHGKAEKQPDTRALERRLATLRRDAKQRGRQGVAKARQEQERKQKRMAEAG